MPVARNVPADPPWVWVDTPSALWQVSREFTDSKFVSRLDAPEQLLQPPASPLRTGMRQRLTHLVRATLPEYPELAMVIKPYRQGNVMKAVRDLVRPHRARRAFERAHQLQRLGIPTAQPIAAGQISRRRWPGDAYLIAAYVENARPLRELRRTVPSDPRTARQLVRELGKILARLHNAGLTHSDPSLSNFLVQSLAPADTNPALASPPSTTEPQPKVALRLVLIDLDGLRDVGTVSRGQLVTGLTLLLRRIPMTDRERLWFACEYCRTRSIAVEARELLQMLTRNSLASPAHQAGPLAWTSPHPAARADYQEVLADPDRFLAQEQLQYKSSRVVTVVRIPARSPDEPCLVLRRLNYGKLLHRCRDFLRRSRAVRALHNAWMLEAAGIATPRAYAAAERRCCRWPLAAYLITAEVAHAQNLHVYLRNERRAPPQLASRLAILLARLHNHGFSHRDLKATNLLVDGSLQPWLIDLDGLRHWQPLAPERAITDLLRFARGLGRHREYLALAPQRFLIRYCQQRKPPCDPRALAGALAAAWPD